MRRPSNGAPFVPPNPICPVPQRGEIPDLTAVPFEFIVESYGRTSTWGAHCNSDSVDDDFPYVETENLELTASPSDVALAERLHRLAGLDDLGGTRITFSTDSPVVEQMRLKFCERVANCQGVIDGQCWALGVSAVREVVEEVLNANEV